MAFYAKDGVQYVDGRKGIYEAYKRIYEMGRDIFEGKEKGYTVT